MTPCTAIRVAGQGTNNDTQPWANVSPWPKPEEATIMRSTAFFRQALVPGVLALAVFLIPILAVAQAAAPAGSERSHAAERRADGKIAMKTIGLIGGMSWESSIIYYRLINEDVKARLGGLHSAKSVMYSVDFADIVPLQREGKWAELSEKMVEAARHVEDGGADFIVICTNTMHKTASEIEKHVDIPLLHIVDVTAEKIKAANLSKVGLLGTRFTMEDDFYKGRLIDKYGLEVVIPTEKERQDVHRIIFEELCIGEIKPESKKRYREIMDNLVRRGAHGIILGCTEIGLLVGPEDSSVPLFDTAKIHAEAAVDYALEKVAPTRKTEAVQNQRH